MGKPNVRALGGMRTSEEIAREALETYMLTTYGSPFDGDLRGSDKAIARAGIAEGLRQAESLVKCLDESRAIRARLRELESGDE